MIVCVTPNPAIDLTYRVPAIRDGTVNRVESVTSRPGGKGVNVGFVLRSLGVDALHALPLGGEAGRWVDERLGDDGFPRLSFPIVGETRRTVTVAPPDVHPTSFYEPGPRMSSGVWERFVDEILHSIERDRPPGRPGVKAVVISGSLPPGLGGPDLAAAVRRFRAWGAIVGVDTSGGALRDAAEAGADFVKPNAEELAEATGITAWHEAAHSLVDAGATLVAVSHGADGLSCCTAERCVRAVPPELVGNPTGAGDATVAGLVDGLVAGLPLDALAASAAATGAAAVLCETAGGIDTEMLPSIIRATQTEEWPCP